MRDREKFHHRTGQLLEAIKLCMEKKLELPALVLMYSSMDTLGWLYSDDPKAKINENFKRWVSQYVTADADFNVVLKRRRYDYARRKSSNVRG